MASEQTAQPRSSKITERVQAIRSKLDVNTLAVESLNLPVPNGGANWDEFSDHGFNDAN